MRGPRAIVVGLLLGAMVLWSAAAASAATVNAAPFSDVPTGNPYATAVGFLSQEGIIGGIGGGLYGPNLPVTRAQMAKIVVGMLGDGAVAASLASTQPSFKDAASIPAWAWGYVNDAQAVGIIKGYPDGTFRPNGDVTGAEALAIFTRALGDDWSVTGVWPTNYAVAGFKLGIATGLTGLSATAPALRGQVAQMAYNAALNAQYTVVTSGTNTLHAGGLYGKNATTGAHPSAVTGAASAVGAGSMAIQPASAASPTTYALAPSVTLAGASALGSALDGATVTAVLDSNSQINWVGVTASSGSPTASAKTLNDGTQTAPPSGFVAPSSGQAAQANRNAGVLLVVQDDAGNDYLLFKDGSTLEYLPTTTVTVDGTSYGRLQGNEAGMLKAGDTVTYSAPNGLASSIALQRWAVADGVITSVNPTTGVIKTTTPPTSPALVQNYSSAAANAAVTLNGAPSSLADLRLGDVVDIELQGTHTPSLSGGTPAPAVAVRATRRTVTGQVTGENTSAGTNGTTVTTITLQTSSGPVTVTEAPHVALTLPSPPTEATVFLDAAGQAAYSETAAGTEQVVLLTGVGVKVVGSTTERTLTGIGAAGTVTYAVSSGFDWPASLASGGSGFNKFWTLRLASAGTVDTVYPMQSVTLPSGDTLRVQTATAQTVVVELVRSDGTVDTSSTPPSGPGWTFAGGYLVITHGGAWSGTHPDTYIGFAGVQAGDPVTLAAADALGTAYFAIVDAAR